MPRKKGMTGQTDDVNICLNCPLPWCDGGRDYGELHSIRTGSKKRPVYFCPRDWAVYLLKARQENQVAPLILQKVNGLTNFREILTDDHALAALLTTVD